MIPDSVKHLPLHRSGGELGQVQDSESATAFAGHPLSSCLGRR